MCNGLLPPSCSGNFANLWIPILLSECLYHLNIMLSTSHSSFLRDIMSSSSERNDPLVLLYLGAKAEKTEMPMVV